LGGFQETTGTDALCLILADADAARAVSAAVRSGLPELPEELRFVAQLGEGDSRPDVVGLRNDRQVLFIEGKLWAGLTAAQADGTYLRRLAKDHAARDPAHICAGIVLWVCPRRRADLLWAEVVQQSRAQPTSTSLQSRWRFARTAGGQGVALVDWSTLCDTLEHAGPPTLAEDVRQLRGFVEAVDRHAFVPWTLEQVTDQDTPQRHVELFKLAEDIRERGLRSGVLDSVGRNRPASSGPDHGTVIYPGGLWTAFLVSPSLQAARGRSPWWLCWYSGAAIARLALRDHGLVDLPNGCAVPVPLRPGARRDGWLADIGTLLRTAKSEHLASGAETDGDDSLATFAEGEPDGA
jgi:hypothetical protein